MPTYQYSCTECGHFFEQVQSFSDDALTTCPECAGRLRKVFNAVGVVFKGSGFYRTDSRAGADKDAGAGTSGQGDKGDKGDKGASTGTAASGSSGSGGSGSGASSTKDSSASGSGSTGSGGSKSTTSGSAA